MNRRVELAVIGTGTAATTAAMACREAGWSVAIADSRPYGGTCALRGCDPKKVLVGAAEIVDRARRLEGRGIGGETRIAWPELSRFKRSFTEPVPPAREKAFAEKGIACLHGAARFLAPGRLRVGEDEIEAAHCLIATGMRPQTLPFPGQERLLTSDGFLDLERLPKSIVFIGGGYISFEFAHIAARAGARITILDDRPRPLENFDGELVGKLVEASRELGMEIHSRLTVEAVEKSEHGFLVRAKTAEGAEREFTAALAVHGAGRVPEIDELQLEDAGIEYDRKAGVKVSPYLQSLSQPAV